MKDRTFVPRKKNPHLAPQFHLMSVITDKSTYVANREHSWSELGIDDAGHDIGRSSEYDSLRAYLGRGQFGHDRIASRADSTSKCEVKNKHDGADAVRDVGTLGDTAQDADDAEFDSHERLADQVDSSTTDSVDD